MNTARRTRGFIMRHLEGRAYIMQMRTGMSGLGERAGVRQQGNARLPQYQEENRNPIGIAPLIRPKTQYLSP
ncbi:MAG TPA: hypothetical protein VM100_07275, partial [Longimicrobiales bacterium]|nr:hypothetical protein [Longimicrobiales bacterium]